MSPGNGTLWGSRDFYFDYAQEARTIKKKPKPIPRVISALTARARLGQILKRVSENGERFIVDRHGEPTAVIMSIRDFVDTIAPPPNFLKEIWAESKRQGTDKLTMREIDAEIRTYRREKRAKETTAAT